MLSPLICGKWDGCHAWLQWTACPDALEYAVEFSYKKPDGEWTSWDQVIPPQGSKSDWGVIPTWKEGWYCRARVRAVMLRGMTDWEQAMEVTFSGSHCEFEFSSEHQAVHFEPGVIFHSVVDGAACSYVLRTEIYLEKGQCGTAVLHAAAASGWHQLDYPGHFKVMAGYGVRVRNLGPSKDDVQELGFDFTRIEAGEFTGLSIAITPRTDF